MTLSTQNKFLLFFSFLSAIIGAFFIVGIIVFFYNSALNAPDTISLISLLTETTQVYSIHTLIFFALYVPIAGFTVYFTFEKTKSPEMLYYIAMLIGFFAETFLLCIPIFSLQNGYTTFLHSISSIAFFGKIQVILSILLQGVLIAQEASRDSDRFIGIISVVALAFAVIIPIDVTTITVDIFPSYGFESLFSIIRVSFIIIAFCAMFLSPASKKSADYKKASIAFFIMSIGYIILTNTKSFISLCTGSLFVIIGTAFFLKHLHNYYMWK